MSIKHALTAIIFVCALLLWSAAQAAQVAAKDIKPTNNASSASKKGTGGTGSKIRGNDDLSDDEKASKARDRRLR